MANWKVKLQPPVDPAEGTIGTNYRRAGLVLSRDWLDVDPATTSASVLAALLADQWLVFDLTASLGGNAGLASTMLTNANALVALAARHLKITQRSRGENLGSIAMAAQQVLADIATAHTAFIASHAAWVATV